MTRQAMARFNRAPIARKQTRYGFLVKFVIAILAIASLGAACEPETQRVAQSPGTLPQRQETGPQTWIEFPAEGEILPMVPIPFVVYAADPQNIAGIDLRVNGQQLPAVQVQGLGAGGGHLTRLDQTWQPPAEGQYILEARARNSAGTYGAPTQVKFCVGSCKPPTATPTTTPAPLTPASIPTLSQPTTTPTTRPSAQYDLYVRRMDLSPSSPAAGDKIQLRIMIATDTYPAQGPFFPASYLRWRQGPNFPWREESCPANMQYANCEKMVEFSYDQPGNYNVQVEADSRQGIAETNETNNAAGGNLVVGPARIAPATINFRSDAPYVNGGSCTTLRWDVDNAQAVYLDGQAVTGHGSKQVCPCQQTTYTLRVIKRDNTPEDRQVTIGLYGTCPAPPAPATTSAPPPPQDRTGPSISGTGLKWQDCKFIGYATITDPSSVPSAQFWYNLNGRGWQSVSMFPFGGRWEATQGISVMSGIGSPMGSVQYYFTATDGVGNQSRSGTSTHNYVGCGG